MGSPFAMNRRNPMILHSSLTPCEQMPPVSTLTDQAVKVGKLKKLSGKGILTSGTWRDRFCLLVKNRLYFYESEESVGGSDKNSGFVNLEYFDTCTEASTRMAKKSVKNVFVIGSSDKGFFDSHSGRHYFAAETVPEMKEWVNSISSAMKSHIRIKEKRTKRDGSLTPGQTKRDNSVKMSKESDSTNGTLPRSVSVKLDHVTKGRVKGPQGRRLPRKPQRPSNGSDSRADSALDYDDEIAIRDSRGRATSLSALEASSDTHPKTSSCNGTGSPKSKEIHTETENKQVEIFNDKLDNFEMDGSETPDIELIYDYSSSDDQSDDEKKYQLTSFEKTSYIQRRPISRAGSHIRNSSVTPPPCILRKNRREQETGNAPNSCGFTGETSHEQSPSPIFSELMNGLTRASSGSSLSTLTADTYSQITNPNFMNGGPFLSLQRKPKKANGQCIVGNGFDGTQSSYMKTDVVNHRQIVSANASPILSHGHHNHHNHGSSMLMHHIIKQNGFNSHNNSPNNTFDRNSNNFINTGNDSVLERRLFSLTKDLQAMTVEVKQLDITISGIHQDSGTTQENIVSVKGSLNCMKEKVNKIQNQVYNIEKQVASITQEASLIHEQADAILQSVNSVRDEQNNLLEEAKSLVGFLRQSVNCLPATSYMHQHFNAHFGQTNNCCSPSPVPPSFYSSMQQQPQSLRRRGKTPERAIGCEEVNNTDNSNGEYFDSLKTRNTKSAMSNSSSGSSGSSNSANRVSVAVESIERKTGQLLKSPITNSEAKISHL